MDNITTSVKNEKILIVEDEMIISATLEETLNQMGYNNVEAAYTATKALDLLGKNDYDLVLMDIKLGKGMDGVDVVNELHETRNMPVIFVTGNSDTKTVNKAKMSLPDGFITKPFNQNELRIQIELCLFKNKFRKLQSESEELSPNLYFGNCNGLSISTDLVGNIRSIGPQIKKLTGKSPQFYVNKKITAANLGLELTELLENSLKQAKAGTAHHFKGNIYSPFIGERTVKIEVVNSSSLFYQINFTDVTSTEFHNSLNGTFINTAISSPDPSRAEQFKTIVKKQKGLRLAAELSSTESLSYYLTVNSTGIVIIDMSLKGIYDFMMFQKEEINDKIRLLLLTSERDLPRLRHIDSRLRSGIISEDADIDKITNALTQLAEGKNYLDEKYAGLNLF